LEFTGAVGRRERQAKDGSHAVKNFRELSTDKVPPHALMATLPTVPKELGFLGTPKFLEGADRILFAEYLREWYEKKTIPHLQYNCVNSTVLREAQQDPDNYPDLQVRVAEYSAFLVELPTETQDSTTSRMEESIC
jgi:pyruvate-formate lyase